MNLRVLANDADSLIWWDWVGRHTDDIWERTVQHLELTLLTVGIGIVVSALLAAMALKLRPWRRFWTVELPLALPTIMAGVRIATVGTVGLVTISALVGEGGYGALINQGLGRNNFSTPIVVGAALSIVMALVLDLLLWGFQRLITPWDRVGKATA